MLTKIISGGQTGADRAALDFAIENDYLTDGYCPKGRKAEDGKIPEKYSLTETSYSGYQERTTLNVAMADGTLVVCACQPSPGSRLTMKEAQRLNKPLLHLYPTMDMDDAVTALRDFVMHEALQSLNVAGSRASKDPLVYDFTKQVLEKALVVMA